MISTFSRLVALLLTLLFLHACAQPHEGDIRNTCPTLKSNIVFNGATSNVRNAEIQETEAPLTQANYNKQCL